MQDERLAAAWWERSRGPRSVFGPGYGADLGTTIRVLRRISRVRKMMISGTPASSFRLCYWSSRVWWKMRWRRIGVRGTQQGFILKITSSLSESLWWFCSATFTQNVMIIETEKVPKPLFIPVTMLCWVAKGKQTYRMRIISLLTPSNRSAFPPIIPST